ncbi:MAG: hypothetical protein J6K52_03045 [Clostridia bacterium]|nr:hypothetical protein [Clostridia bacterium]
MKNILIVKEEKKEKCLVCGKETEYLISTPIQERLFYIEGAGQFCQACHYDIYIKKNRSDR